MEQIALMALPREATDDSDAESACTTQENSSHVHTKYTRDLHVNSGGRNYWSVSDQLNFQRLLAQFGSDFEAIAEAMKPKTATMVSKIELYIPSLEDRN